MSWFEQLTGFEEQSPEHVRANLVVDGEQLVSRVNGRSFTFGRLELASLAALRQQAAGGFSAGKLRLREVVADVQQLHLDPANAGALFQVASQFNLLEMVHPGMTPELGVGIYENDFTQGPACAIAAGAGTIYRNYFVDVDGQIGQSADRQIDGLAEIGKALGNHQHALWRVMNGYMLPTPAGLAEVSARLAEFDDDAKDALKQKLRVGIQWHTEVTLGQARHTVSQAYCSALPIAYCQSENMAEWELFARLILEAAYEACICAAIINARQTGNPRVFLTLLGGGVFGNPLGWIIDSIGHVLERYRNSGLEVGIVSHRNSQPEVRLLLARVLA